MLTNTRSIANVDGRTLETSHVLAEMNVTRREVEGVRRSLMHACHGLLLHAFRRS